MTSCDGATLIGVFARLAASVLETETRGRQLLSPDSKANTNQKKSEHLGYSGDVLILVPFINRKFIKFVRLGRENIDKEIFLPKTRGWGGGGFKECKMFKKTKVKKWYEPMRTRLVQLEKRAAGCTLDCRVGGSWQRTVFIRFARPSPTVQPTPTVAASAVLFFHTITSWASQGCLFSNPHSHTSAALLPVASLGVQKR